MEKENITLHSFRKHGHKTCILSYLSLEDFSCPILDLICVFGPQLQRWPLLGCEGNSTMMVIKAVCCPQSKTRLAFHFLSFSQFVWLQFTSSSYILLSNSLHTFLCSSQQVLSFVILWMSTNPTPHVCRLQEANLEACGTMVVSCD